MGHTMKNRPHESKACTCKGCAEYDSGWSNTNFGGDLSPSAFESLLEHIRKHQRNELDKILRDCFEGAEARVVDIRGDTIGIVVTLPAYICQQTVTVSFSNPEE